MKLTGKEIYQIQFLLPIQGNIQTLELVQQILDKIDIKEEDREDEYIRDVKLTDPDLDFLREMIGVLDNADKLNFHGLSLYRKILSKE